MPNGHNINCQTSGLYTGSALTVDEEQGAATALAACLSDYLSSLGKSVVSVDGIIIHGIGGNAPAQERPDAK